MDPLIDTIDPLIATIDPLIATIDTALTNRITEGERASLQDYRRALTTGGTVPEPVEAWIRYMAGLGAPPRPTTELQKAITAESLNRMRDSAAERINRLKASAAARTYLQGEIDVALTNWITPAERSSLHICRRTLMLGRGVLRDNEPWIRYLASLGAPPSPTPELQKAVDDFLQAFDAHVLAVEDLMFNYPPPDSVRELVARLPEGETRAIDGAKKRLLKKKRLTKRQTLAAREAWDRCARSRYNPSQALLDTLHALLRRLPASNRGDDVDRYLTRIAGAWTIPSALDGTAMRIKLARVGHVPDDGMDLA